VRTTPIFIDVVPPLEVLPVPQAASIATTARDPRACSRLVNLPLKI